jgi:hypothetical protein
MSVYAVVHVVHVHVVHVRRACSSYQYYGVNAALDLSLARGIGLLEVRRVHEVIAEFQFPVRITTFGNSQG